MVYIRVGEWGYLEIYHLSGCPDTARTHYERRGRHACLSMIWGDVFRSELWSFHTSGGDLNKGTEGTYRERNVAAKGGATSSRVGDPTSSTTSG
ncbi:hypothetical protein Tco_0271955 [Tanacetum coccineum]